MGFVESPTSLIRVKNEKRGGKENGTGRSDPLRGKGGGEEERGGSGEAAMAPCARTQKKKRKREEGEWVFFIMVCGDDGETPRGG